MRVALDTNGIYVTQAGVARYIRGLIKGLKALKPVDCQWFELAWPVENFSYQQPQRALKTLYRELVWSRFIAPRRLRRNGADLYHATSPSFVVPPDGISQVVTLHDLAVLIHPQRFRKWQRHSTRRRLEITKKAERVVCISRFTADEAIRLIDLNPARIEVVPNGCDFHESEPPPDETVPKFDLPSEFFLFVGSLEPGKNLALLRQAYELATRQGNPLPPLVIVGVRWEGVGTEGTPPRDWHYVGRQSDAALVFLYRRALALLFPSRYEGFGLPVVEAMALGCPVICSRIASIPEVGGDAPLYSELDPASYASSMRRLLADKILREEMIARGRRQAAGFSWRKCAEQTVEVYRAVRGG